MAAQTRRAGKAMSRYARSTVMAAMRTAAGRREHADEFGEVSV